MTSVNREDELRAQIQSALADATKAGSEWVKQAKDQAGLDLEALLDPEGDAVQSLVDGEASQGASLLAAPMDLLQFETWVLGHLGDHDGFDFDVGAHKDLWFAMGAWIGDLLLRRHGGFWMVPSTDPQSWRIGFSQVMLEIAPHVFVQRLLGMGNGFAKLLVSEIDRIRQNHDDAKAAGRLGKLGPEHYARLHSMPLGQWMVLDMATLQGVWAKQPVSGLVAGIEQQKKQAPENVQAFMTRVQETLAAMQQDKPAIEQNQDRRLFEAVAQLAAIRWMSSATAMDVIEKIVMPAAHLNPKGTFPPLGDDDVGNVNKGMDLFAVYVDVMPYQHSAEEEGFLGTFAMNELGSPYPDKQNLDLGKGDWIVVNPARLNDLLKGFEPGALLASFDRFVEYVRKQEGIPRLAQDTPRGLAQTADGMLAEVKKGLGVLNPQHALVFRLLPPPAAR